MINNMTQNPTIRVETEEKHFESVVTEVGYSWWGSNTPDSTVRIQKRVNLTKEFLDVKRGDKLLECGCGTGEFTSQLSEELDSQVIVYAMDLSRTLIQATSKRLQRPNVKFLVGNVAQTDFQDNCFDCVIGNGILHHLDLNSSINEFKRILKPSGKILFFEPNMANSQIWLQFHVKLFRKITRISPYEKTFLNEIAGSLLIYAENNK